MEDPKPGNKQIEKPRELDRKIGANESERPLIEVLRKVANARRNKAEKGE